MTRTQLGQTDTELLLFIHASQKERAKRIERRRWDPKRRCWVYPKSTLVYDALVAEFGDDLVSLSVPRPKPNASTARQEANVRAENGAIEKQLRERERELEVIKRALKEEQREANRLREITATLETKNASSPAGSEEFIQLMQEMKRQQGTRQFAESM
jgi:hypothetical protein